MYADVSEPGPLSINPLIRLMGGDLVSRETASKTAAPNGGKPKAALVDPSVSLDRR